MNIGWRAARRASEAAINELAPLPLCETVIRFHTPPEHLRQTPRLLFSQLAETDTARVTGGKPKDQK